MKSTGIVRRVDDLGRVVIPIELRRTLSIHQRDPMEIFVDGDKIIFRKCSPACVFCGKDENLRSFQEKSVCLQCLRAMQDVADGA